MEKADFGGKGKPDAWRIKAGVSQSLEALPSVRAQEDLWPSSFGGGNSAWSESFQGNEWAKGLGSLADQYVGFPPNYSIFNLFLAPAFPLARGSGTFDL